MSEVFKKKEKKEVIKEIIHDLHDGLTLEDAKLKFEKEAGSVTPSEIAEIEQSLINDGMSVDEIKKFCNVHALLFETSLTGLLTDIESASHPVYLFKMENREIEKRINNIKEIMLNKKNAGVKVLAEELRESLSELKEIELHYTRKEQLLFPFLEKYGFMGPSKVMWGKDNEIRDLLKSSIAAVNKIASSEDLSGYLNEQTGPLIEEIAGMIFKEENILFPASLEKLSVNDWVDILKESDEIGYSFIEKPGETSRLISELKASIAEIPEITGKGAVKFPTGEMELKELMLMLNSLPVDITFIDKDDTVRYFSDNKDRIFVRTRSVIGRKVQNCHPPQSVETVEKILNAFKAGRRSNADFWINFKDRLIYIKFIAVRDEFGDYTGTIELTMDTSRIRSLEGEKRLLDEQT